MAHIFVIAGHGAGDPGACGNGYQEAERVRALASRIAAFGGSNVTVGDTNRNWYADNGISSLNIPKDWQIIELHMDSAAASARGGHVIIKSGFSADAYDNALANLVGSILPGRSNLIVGRSDLANPKRAAAKGYGYRLVEFGFISNATDVQIFNSRMDDLAKGIVEAFQNTAANNPDPSVPVATTPSGSEVLEEDGSFGPASVRRSQQYYGTVVDAIVSYQPASNQKYLCAVYTGCWRFLESGYGKGSDMIRAMQTDLKGRGYYKGNVDGWCGKQTVIALQMFLRDQGYYTGAIDGSMGPQTVTAWQKFLNNH